MIGAWRTRWEPIGDDSIEIFTSPDGHQFKRATGTSADLELPMPYGLPPLRLSSIDHWFAAVDSV
jgi:hypothetical protein